MTRIAETIVKVALEKDKVLAHARRKRDRALFILGAYTKRAIQRSMRYSNKPSQPGQPPRAHKKRSAGPLLRQLTDFQVDKRRGRVVIGPKKFRALSQPSGKPVPQVLNEGGRVKARLEGKPIVAELEARPFTKPAFTDGGKRLDTILEKEPF